MDIGPLRKARMGYGKLYQGLAGGVLPSCALTDGCAGLLVVGKYE